MRTNNYLPSHNGANIPQFTFWKSASTMYYTRLIKARQNVPTLEQVLFQLKRKFTMVQRGRKKRKKKSTLCICTSNNLIENGYYTMERILRIPEWCGCIFEKSNKYICIRQLLCSQREISSCIRSPLGIKQSLARKEFSLKQNSLVVCSKYVMTLLTLLHVIKRISFTCKSDLQSICFLIFPDLKS